VSSAKQNVQGETKLVNNNYSSAMHAQGEQDVFLMRSMPHGDGYIEEQCRSTNSMRQRM